MATKEYATISIGAIIIVILLVIFNILLNLNIIISIILGVIGGIITGFIIGRLTQRTILGIIAWGLIIFSILAIILKWLNIINSPPIAEILLSGILVELLRIETKFKEFNVRLNTLWSDFMKRKKI